MLKLDFVNMFLDGFKINSIDNKLNGMDKKGKLEIMKHAVLDALEVDLRLHSSPSRNKKVYKIRYSV